MGISPEGDQEKMELVQNLSEDSKDEGILKTKNLSETVALRIHKVLTRSSFNPSEENDLPEIFELLKDTELDHKSIALKLIRKGNGHFVLENFERFNELDKEVILQLFNAGLGEFVALYLFNIKVQYQSEVNNEELNETFQLVGTHGFKIGTVSLSKEEIPFTDGLDTEVAEELIKAGQGLALASHLEKFIGLDHKHIAEKLIKTNQGFAIAEYLGKFIGLDNQYIASGLIVTRQGKDLGYNIDKFTEVDHKRAAYELIITHQGYSVANNIEKFNGLDHIRIACELLENDQGKDLANNIEKFKGLDHKKLAILLIKTDNHLSVIRNLDKFNNLDKEVLLLLIKSLKRNEQTISDTNLLGQHIYRFEELDSEAATMLFSIGEGSAVAEYLHIFSGVNHEEIAYILIGVGQGWCVIENWYNFKGLNPSKVALKMIETGQVEDIIKDIDEVDEIAQREMAIKLIEAGYCKLVLEFLDIFSNHDAEEFQKLIREKDSSNKG